MSLAILKQHIRDLKLGRRNLKRELAEINTQIDLMTKALQFKCPHRDRDLTYSLSLASHYDVTCHSCGAVAQTDAVSRENLRIAFIEARSELR